FWYCGDPQVLQTLPKYWDGLCTPVLLDGHLTVFEVNETRLEQLLKQTTHPQTHSRSRRDTTLNDISLNKYFTLGNSTHLPQWDTDAFVYVDWSGEPAGVPEQYRALQEASSTAWMVFLPHVQIHRNMKWINYIWYNQQRFINHTITALDLMAEQLHATTMMTVQNRFALDTMRGPDQGVCTLFGSDCCAIIPLHTGPTGSLNTVFHRMKAMRKEATQNNAFPDPAWYKWLMSGDWFAGLIRIMVVIGIVLIAVLLLIVCGIPLIRALIDKTVHS
ncbi:hypothetical protein C0J50_22732, partial [Silurus asotus]